MSTLFAVIVCPIYKKHAYSFKYITYTRAHSHGAVLNIKTRGIGMYQTWNRGYYLSFFFHAKESYWSLSLRPRTVKCYGTQQGFYGLLALFASFNYFRMAIGSK